MRLEQRKFTDLSPVEKRDMAKQLLRQADPQGRPNRAASATPVDADIPPEFYRFELFPGYRALEQQADTFRRLNIENPYFNCHLDVSRHTLTIGQCQYINYSGYNYLGLSGHPAVSQAAKAAIDQYGTSVSASRIVSGEIPLHRELEQELAELVEAEACLVFVSGYGANVSTIGHLFGPKDLLLHDALIHNSALTGCQLAGSRRIAFPHNDWEALDRLLAENRRYHERVLIVLEGVYSMDGDIPNLPKFIEVKQRHKALLMVDEAHSAGVLGARGRGIGEHFGIDGADVDIWMGTLSKAFASCGGYIAGSRALIDYLKYTAPGAVLYSVGMSPPNAAAALAAVRLFKQEPERVTRLRVNAQRFLALAKGHGLNTGPSHGSAVVPVILGHSVRCLKLAQELFARRINVQPMLYPSVSEDAARLRFFITSEHGASDIQYTVETVARQLRDLETGD